MQDNHILTWPQSANNLRETLLVSRDNLKCHGVTLAHTGCKRTLGKARQGNISRLLDDVVAAGNLAAARTLLDRLSRLVMCGKIHEPQGYELLRKWEQALEEAEQRHREYGAAKTAAINVKVDVNHAASGKLAVDVKQTASGKLEVNVQSEPALPQIVPHQAIKSELENKFGPDADTSIRAITSCPQDKATLSHIFVPYGKPRTQQHINKAIKGILGKPLSRKEIESLAKEGVVYIYTFADVLHTQKKPHLKIGYSADYTRRMQAWARRCGYKPGDMCQTTANLYMRVERLVHAQLWPHRRREDKCPGCGGAHKEFFDVRLSEASRVIGLWAEWMRLNPYDENEGYLKKEWRDKLEKINLEDPNCWDDFTSGE
ncbi:hypothetical protein NQ176_g3696 [Zarea fungicola]|uniref:Uncharacterized protein n=1 Tax=Zarea fungicola TaxID=93591 RepID=A0ACC1NH87_9HYPO|nr:hypothetical protein NQ176_g3696 [Lecanicillium fungicola]